MRIFLSIAAALGITTALLLLMNALIGDPEKILKQETLKEPVIVNVVIPEDKKPPREPLKLQPPAIVPTKNPSDIFIAVSPEDSLLITFSEVEIVNPQPMNLPNNAGYRTLQEADRSAIAMYQAHPSYPMEAQLKGIEGYVVLSFDVDKSGAASNIRIVEAQPRQMFNKEAKRALKKWKFKPALEDGKEVTVTGQRARLEFTLPEEVAEN